MSTLPAQRPLSARSDLNGENSDHADNCPAVVLDGDETIRADVPVRGYRRLQAGAVVLLNNARYNILGGFVEFRQLLDAVLDDLLRPLVYLLSLVDCVGVDYALDYVLNDLVYLRGVEVLVVLEVCHFVLKLL